MLTNLFTSKTRIEILKLFLLEKDLQIHLREIARRTGSEVNAIKRELENLEEVGILISKKEIQRKYYKLNNNFVFIQELKSIFWKSFSILKDINKETFEKLNFVLVTSNYLQNPKIQHNEVSKEIDLVFVGEFDLNLLEEFMQKSERTYERIINYTVMSDIEWNLKLSRRDTQVLNWMLNENVVLHF